jgi:hypothetical protein
MKMKNKEKIVFKNDIDELLNNKLMGMWNMERRDYYKLEAEDSNMFKGYGDKSGVMYLGDVDYLNDEGIKINSGYNRFNTSLNTNVNVGKFNLFGNINYILIVTIIILCFRYFTNYS